MQSQSQTAVSVQLLYLRTVSSLGISETPNDSRVFLAPDTLDFVALFDGLFN